MIRCVFLLALSDFDRFPVFPHDNHVLTFVLRQHPEKVAASWKPNWEELQAAVKTFMGQVVELGWDGQVSC